MPARNPSENCACSGKENHSKSGQVLIEAMVSIALMTVGFLAVFSLLSRSLSFNRAAADNYVATYIAAEGIEIARSIVDANGIQKKAWNAGFADGDYEVDYASQSLTPTQDRFLTYDDVNHFYGYGFNITTPFKRIVRVTLVGSNEIKVNSIVSWIGLGGGSFNINLEDHFMNWRI